ISGGSFRTYFVYVLLYFCPLHINAPPIVFLYYIFYTISANMSIGKTPFSTKSSQYSFVTPNVYVFPKIPTLDALKNLSPFTRIFLICRSLYHAVVRPMS